MATVTEKNTTLSSCEPGRLYRFWVRAKGPESLVRSFLHHNPRLFVCAITPFEHVLKTVISPVHRWDTRISHSKSLLSEFVGISNSIDRTVGSYASRPFVFLRAVSIEERAPRESQASEKLGTVILAPRSGSSELLFFVNAEVFRSYIDNVKYVSRLDITHGLEEL